MQFCLCVSNNALHVFPLKFTSFLKYYVCEKTHFSKGILWGPSYLYCNHKNIICSLSIFFHRQLFVVTTVSFSVSQVRLHCIFWLILFSPQVMGGFLRFSVIWFSLNKFTCNIYFSMAFIKYWVTCSFVFYIHSNITLWVNSVNKRKFHLRHQGKLNLGMQYCNDSPVHGCQNLRNIWDVFFFFFSYSIKHNSEGDCGTDLPAMGIPLDIKGNSEFKIRYSYSVTFIVS